MANAIDRLIMAVSPGWAAKRAENRYRANLYEKQRKYEGGAKSGRTGGFPLNNTSANKDGFYYAEKLRERGRYLFQNTTYANRAIKTLANGVVGTGIIPSFVTGDKKTLIQLEKYWNLWGNTTKCDFNGRLTFAGITKLITKTYKRDGECLVMRRYVPLSESPIGMQLQVLEMEYLATYINYLVLDGGGYTMNGIEYDKRGKVVAYWLHHRHPSEYWTQPKKIPAGNMLHILEVDFPGQNRGVPAAAPTIITQKDLDEYEDAELMAKKVQAAHAVFRTTMDPEKTDNDPHADDEEYYDDIIERLEPGSMYNLRPGETITFNTPPTAPGAEDYRRSKQRNVAAGYEVTYEQMTGDYSQVNFSSGRMGWLEHNRSVEHIQWITLIPQFCEEAMAWFLEQVSIAPYTGISGQPDDLTVTWTAPRREMIDPLKEIAAIKIMLRAGLTSWQEVVKQFGYIPKDLLEELKKDKEAFQKYDIAAEWSVNLDPKFTTKAQNTDGA